MINNDWHKRVYKRHIKNFITKNDWQKLKVACLKRDNLTCLRCEKKSTQGRGMTAHHLIPRNEDGSDDLSNLVTLCNNCHDFVEINNLRSIADIVGSYEESTLIEHKDRTSIKTEEGYSFIRPEWHKYVYGGARHSM